MVRRAAGSGRPSGKAAEGTAPTTTVTPPIEPMLSASADALPAGDGWLYEPKWDGFRTIAAAGDDGAVRVVSRDGRPLGRYFPEVVALLEEAQRRVGPFVIDGEIVRLAPDWMDFDELQLRQGPGRRVDGIGANRVGSLGDQIKETPVRVQCHVPRSGAGLGVDLARPVGGQRPGGGVKLPLHNDVAAEARRVAVFVGPIDKDAM